MKMSHTNGLVEFLNAEVVFETWGLIDGLEPVKNTKDHSHNCLKFFLLPDKTVNNSVDEIWLIKESWSKEHNSAIFSSSIVVGF